MSRTINQSIRVEASLETIFKAFTDANEMERWWPTSVESDPTVGGSFKFEFDSLDDTEPIQVRAGAYTNVVANESIAYPWNIPGMEPDTDVAIKFNAEGNETVVDLTHTGWPSDAAADEVFDMHDQGWGAFLQNLKMVYEGGTDIRPGMMKMKTKG